VEFVKGTSLKEYGGGGSSSIVNGGDTAASALCWFRTAWFYGFVDHADVEFQRLGEQSSKNSGAGVITV
jgi:hypothetical protein